MDRLQCRHKGGSGGVHRGITGPERISRQLLALNAPPINRTRCRVLPILHSLPRLRNDLSEAAESNMACATRNRSNRPSRALPLRVCTAVDLCVIVYTYSSTQRLLWNLPGT